MSRPVSCPRLEEITRIWRALRPVDRHYISAFVRDIPLLATRHVDWNFLAATIAFWNPNRAVFDILGTKLTPTIEEYRTLISRTAVTHGIMEPNFHTARPTLVSRLLGVPTTRLDAELAYSGSTEIAIEKLLFFIESRAHRVQGDFLRKDLCHALLLLIFMTLLFTRSHSLIDAALASVVLQVVGGGGYETVPEDTARIRFEHTFWEDQTPADRQSNVEQVLDAWRTVITERPYFPEHPTLDERDFQATEKYILRFYRWGPTAHEDLVNSSRVEDGGSPGATPTPNMAIQAELTHIRAERDRLHREVAKKDEHLVDQRQLLRELAQTRAELQRRD
ncbi:hypothetical protein CRG98_008890 [Punica granatum]|uniref:DUF7745 domain-containing protein n=1 Tax=Punica granatum TaxID=22663 RepID=A0A2I0KQ99_PUNGR|nr:hypothetical protein CRG98_008890 [Punica granatum]